MEKHLLRLIPENNRVIIPNFGAFIVSRDAGITVLFNNFLSFNDGLLINHVSAAEGIDTAKATEKVSEYVIRIKQQLEEKGEYTIPGLGRFTRDKSGILRFSQDPEVAQLFADEDTQSEGDGGALLDIDSSEEAATEISDQTEEAVTVTSETVKDEPLLTLDANEPQMETASDEPPVAPEEPAVVAPPTIGPGIPPLTPVPPRRPRRPFGFPPWAIGLLVMIPLVFVLLFFLIWSGPSGDTQVTRLPPVADTLPPKTDADSARLSASESGPGQESPQAAVKENNKPQTVTSSSAGVKKNEPANVALKPYHIIAGSFKSETNAQKRAASLKAMGFSEATSFNNKGMFVVSVLTFNTLKEAQAAQEEILNRHKIESWILRKK